MRMRRQESGDEGVQSGGGAHFVRGAAAKSTKSSDFSWTDRGISFNLSRQLHHVIFSMVRREQASDGLSHLLRLPLSPSLEAILSQQDGSRWRAASNLSLMLTSLPSFLLLRDLRVNIGIALTGLVNFALAFDYVLLVQERMMQ